MTDQFNQDLTIGVALFQVAIVVVYFAAAAIAMLALLAVV